ncbi:hypothetical protein [Zhongshania sp.]|uniref:hypothetical protein n=1 Tax=Zhongshania sp. TaxID=1971902 RepID=UPI001B65726A|nr:hypothetical protein [Zhongshania sp.]MBQ0797554.1 hypothetical protein [Zhongshania sp.]
MNTNRKNEFIELLERIPKERLPAIRTGMNLIIEKDEKLLELIDRDHGVEMFDYINMVHQQRKVS